MSTSVGLCVTISVTSGIVGTKKNKQSLGKIAVRINKTEMCH